MLLRDREPNLYHHFNVYFPHLSKLLYSKFPSDVFISKFELDTVGESICYFKVFGGRGFKLDLCKVHSDYNLIRKDYSGNGCPFCENVNRKKGWKQFAINTYGSISEAGKHSGSFRNHRKATLNSMKSKEDSLNMSRLRSVLFYSLYKPKRIELIEKQAKLQNISNWLVTQNYTRFSIHERDTVLWEENGIYVSTKFKNFMRNGFYKNPKSTGENMVSSVLKDLQILFKTQHYIPTKQFLDFYLPEHNIAIEVDGEQHYCNDTRFSSPRVGILDRKKERYLKRKGIKLFRLKYKDFNNFNLNIYDKVKDYLENKINNCK